MNGSCDCGRGRRPERPTVAVWLVCITTATGGGATALAETHHPQQYFLMAVIQRPRHQDKGRKVVSLIPHACAGRLGNAVGM
jgi:hypothetical protein